MQTILASIPITLNELDAHNHGHWGPASWGCDSRGLECAVDVYLLSKGNTRLIYANPYINRLLMALRAHDRERLVEQLVTRTASKPVPLVEATGAIVRHAQLELHPNDSRLRHFTLGLGQERSTEARAANIGTHEEFVDLGHHSAVFEAEQIYGEQVARRRRAMLRDPAGATLRERDQRAEVSLDSRAIEAGDPLERPILLDE